MTDLSIAITLHALSAVIWVGGMFFAYMAMRPAVGKVIDPAQRPELWCHTLSRFFGWVWLCLVVLLLSGYYMIFKVLGGMAGLGLHIHLMQGLGILMMLIFLHAFFAPYGRLKRAVSDGNHEAGAASIGQIRFLVGLNLILGLVVVVIGVGGRYVVFSP